MEIYDFARSTLTFRIDTTVQQPVTASHKPPYSLNNVRIPIECCCELINQKTGSTTMYVLGADCKTERVGVKGEVWVEPNANFCMVASQDELLIIKSWAHKGIKVMRFPESLGPQPERQSQTIKEAYTDFRIDLCLVPGKVLESGKVIVQAVLDRYRLVSRTEYDDGDYHVCIQHPVKSINANERDNIYQTDTGPILLPDLSPQRVTEAGRMIEVFELAYSAFNCPDWAEFVINAPTDVTGQIQVNHYSKFRRIENTRNAMIQID